MSGLALFILPIPLAGVALGVFAARQLRAGRFRHLARAIWLLFAAFLLVFLGAILTEFLAEFPTGPGQDVEAPLAFILLGILAMGFGAGALAVALLSLRGHLASRGFLSGKSSDKGQP